MSDLDSLQEVQIALLGGTSDGKTTFIISMINSMSRKLVNISDNHTLRLQPVGLKKGLVLAGNAKDVQEDYSEDLKKVAEKINTEAKGNIASRMARASSSAGQSRSTGNSIDKAGNINILDKEEGSAEAAAAVMELTDQLARLFTFPNIGGRATFATVTTRYIVITFNVLVDEKEVCKLVITDYAGEVVELGQDRTVLDSLKNSFAIQIADSDSAILLANATKLSKNLNSKIMDNTSMFNEAQTKSSLNVDNITPIITSTKSVQPYSIIVAISQTDHPSLDSRIIRNNFKDVEYQLQKYIYQSLAVFAFSNKKAFGILPVCAFGKNSAGEPNVDQNNMLIKNSDPNPQNIDKTVLFCLYNVLIERDAEICKEMRELQGFFLPKEKKQKKIKLTALHDQFRILIDAITESNGYFDDVYEMHHDMNKSIVPDPRFPKEQYSDIVKA